MNPRSGRTGRCGWLAVANASGTAGGCPHCQHWIWAIAATFAAELRALSNLVTLSRSVLNGNGPVLTMKGNIGRERIVR